MKLKLVKRSICACGYPTVKPGIPLGTEYVSLHIAALGNYFCGGCGSVQKMEMLMVLREGRAGFLPGGIFEPVEARVPEELALAE